ncbi:hypothetical protein CDL15_Pgr004679 [Punica granatum]|uniref:Agamous-like MADS-box protein AGL62 n=1 Tax=Punica granatum TaxID=22663 RepID=A0A218W5Q3_PUNGR|nr:hypothetical protein CDL15_Pgr004679 [Punica granatum]PKI68190.1 hypothetical protein CRG98_011389 [Punica granatum]
MERKNDAAGSGGTKDQLPQYWWETPVENMEVEELEFFIERMETMRKKVLLRMEEIRMVEMPSAPAAGAAEASSSAEATKSATKKQGGK